MQVRVRVKDRVRSSGSVSVRGRLPSLDSFILWLQGRYRYGVSSRCGGTTRGWSVAVFKRTTPAWPDAFVDTHTLAAHEGGQLPRRVRRRAILASVDGQRALQKRRDELAERLALSKTQGAREEARAAAACPAGKGT